MKGPSTVVLRMGTAEHKVHINRVRPLLMKDTQNPVVEQDWSPPLFTYEFAEEQPRAGNIDSEPDRLPSVLVHHQSSGPHPTITTRSGRVVKPVQRFGRTARGLKREVCDELNSLYTHTLIRINCISLVLVIVSNYTFVSIFRGVT